MVGVLTANPLFFHMTTASGSVGAALNIKDVPKGTIAGDTLGLRSVVHMEPLPDDTKNVMVYVASSNDTVT
jgi:hypothetical protein